MGCFLDGVTESNVHDPAVEFVGEIHVAPGHGQVRSPSQGNFGDGSGTARSGGIGVAVAAKRCNPIPVAVQYMNATLQHVRYEDAVEAVHVETNLLANAAAVAPVVRRRHGRDSEERPLRAFDGDRERAAPWAARIAQYRSRLLQRWGRCRSPEKSPVSWHLGARPV